ncbi:enhancer of split m8 protein-like [Anastrepha ludens]|uniref:enhancer of split m8 protein-like n=1 Tax=Anastrepha ludens TaxID=28586 RepID=UPI0023B17589|nr:enhancer of split m8 protein-like [Anastrepha ludens]
MAQPSKTQIYLKVKKPLLERQRRMRINNCLNSLRKLVAELQADDKVLRMDKAELLEQTLVFVREQCGRTSGENIRRRLQVPTDAFNHGYLNAVNEVSRVMASTTGMGVEFGKSVMTHLGRNYNRLQHHQQQLQQQVTHQQYDPAHMPTLSIECAPLSPASSGYYSDCESSAASPFAPLHTTINAWRPW